MAFESCLYQGFVLTFANIGVTFSDFVVIIIFGFGLVFYARDVRVGIILHLLMYSLTFLWFYNAQTNYNCDFNWVKPLVMVMLFFVLLTLTLLATKQSPQTGRIV